MLRLEIRRAFRYSSIPCPHFSRINGAAPVNFIRHPDHSHILGYNPNSYFSHPRYSTMSRSEPIQYHWVDGVERLEMYEVGGYHPVMINDFLHDRYRILDKLGFGGYSTIWLARDEQLLCYIAIKVNTSSQPLPRHESTIIRALSSPRSTSHPFVTGIDGHDAIPRILDEFEIQGPNGTHACYTVAPAQGNLKQASFSRLFPIQVARALAAKLATAVSFVHSRGFVHGDIHLRNVLVRLPSTFDKLSVDKLREMFGPPEQIPINRVDGKPLLPNIPSQAVVPLYLGKKAQEFTLEDARGLVLSDFGEAFAPSTEQRLGKDCNTPMANRAPEAFFELDAPLSYPSDVWSLGIAIWDILGMKSIFSESETKDETAAQQIDVLGLQHFPVSWQKSWVRSNVEQEDEHQTIPRQSTVDREIWPTLEKAFEEFVQKYRRKREAAGACGEEETQAILDLMRGMLKPRPEERLTIDEVLRSEWMVRWALPQL